MARLIVTRRADGNLERIYKHIAKDSVLYATNWLEKMREALRKLERYPTMGYPAEFEGSQGLRILAQGSYKIIYRHLADKDIVEVVFILHEAQLPPAEVL
jgi:plasmid stabilization system protein ParE